MNGQNRRGRGSFTAEQTAVLEQFFNHTPYPDVTTRDTLSERLNIDVSRIQIWFSNRRARTRKVIKPSVSPQPSPLPYAVESPITTDNSVFHPTFVSSPSTGLSRYHSCSSKGNLCRVFSENWCTTSSMTPYAAMHSPYYQQTTDYYYALTPSMMYSNNSMSYPSFTSFY